MVTSIWSAENCFSHTPGTGSLSNGPWTARSHSAYAEHLGPPEGLGFLLVLLFLRDWFVARQIYCHSFYLGIIIMSPPLFLPSVEQGSSSSGIPVSRENRYSETEEIHSPSGDLSEQKSGPEEQSTRAMAQEAGPYSEAPLTGQSGFQCSLAKGSARGSPCPASEALGKETQGGSCQAQRRQRQE